MAAPGDTLLPLFLGQDYKSRLSMFTATEGSAYFASLAHQHTQRLQCWLRGSTTVRPPQRISMTTVWIELSRRSSPSPSVREVAADPMALCQGRPDDAPEKVANAGNRLQGLPHLHLLLLLLPRKKSRCSKRSADSELMEKRWAVVSHQGTMFSE
ncbi:UNVERIFIED_CONTAM: hypothetical protein FKN15_050917 [Acipenser sinensis]